MLTKDEPVAFREWTLTFKGFDMTKQNAVPGALTVGVVVEIQRPGAEPVSLEPSMVSTDDGVQPVAVEIPGGRRQDPRNRDERRSGRGAGRVARSRRRHRPHRDARTRARPWPTRNLAITFDDFDLSDFDPEAGRINFGVVFTVEHGGQSSRWSRPSAAAWAVKPQVTSAAVPGLGRHHPDSRPHRRRGRNGATPGLRSAAWRRQHRAPQAWCWTCRPSR